MACGGELNQAPSTDQRVVLYIYMCIYKFVTASNGCEAKGNTADI